MQSNKEKILLHTCCAPCSTYVIDRLSSIYTITALFYNPNIQPEDEYTKRFQAMKKFCKLKKTELLEFHYDVNFWIESIKGLENEPEGGRRCSICFEVRLRKAAEIAVHKGFKGFATTLSVSPHKNAKLINTIGTHMAGQFGLHFLEYDFKKGDGFKKCCELSRLYGLYRQKYCGCLFSMGSRE